MLTLQTGSGPLSHIRFDAWPHVSGGDELLSCSDPWVGEPMQRIKYLAPESFWYKWARNPCGHITDQRDLSELVAGLERKIPSGVDQELGLPFGHWPWLESR